MRDTWTRNRVGYLLQLQSTLRYRAEAVLARVITVYAAEHDRGTYRADQYEFVGLSDDTDPDHATLKYKAEVYRCGCCGPDTDEIELPASLLWAPDEAIAKIKAQGEQIRQAKARREALKRQQDAARQRESELRQLATLKQKYGDG